MMRNQTISIPSRLDHCSLVLLLPRKGAPLLVVVVVVLLLLVAADLLLGLEWRTRSSARVSLRSLRSVTGVGQDMALTHL